MIVFKYFFEKMAHFGPLMDEYEQSIRIAMPGEHEEQMANGSSTDEETEQEKPEETYLTDEARKSCSLNRM